MSDDEAIGWIEAWLEAGVEFVSDAEIAWKLLSELVSASQRVLRDSIDDARPSRGPN